MPVLSVVLYILGILLAAFTIRLSFDPIRTVGDNIANGSLSIFKDTFKIISYLVGSFGPYIIYTMLFFAAGRILQYAATAATFEIEFEDEDYEEEDNNTETVENVVESTENANNKENKAQDEGE